MTMTKMRTFTLKELARSFSETILRPFVSCVGSSFPFFGSWMETILFWTMMTTMLLLLMLCSLTAFISEQIFKCQSVEDGDDLESEENNEKSNSIA